jgi:hypothetical protein
VTRNSDVGAKVSPGRVGRVVSIAIAVVFGLLFAFYLYEAISQVLQLQSYVTGQNELLRKLGHSQLALPWIALVPLLVLPLVTYALAFFLGRHRTPLIELALFVMGLAVLSAGSLTLESIASQLTRIN